MHSANLAGKADSLLCERASLSPAVQQSLKYFRVPPTGDSPFQLISYYVHHLFRQLLYVLVTQVDGQAEFDVAPNVAGIADLLVAVQESISHGLLGQCDDLA